ncbi:MAG TPA: hypothetical protein VN894_20935, partial [Polyangiaceae bacterium]|nr:hypothetical protein [Polyangiaceae bacterium]
LVLADVSRSMALAGDGGQTRRAARDEAIAKLQASGQNARLVVLGFGAGAPVPLRQAGAESDATAQAPRSDLGTAVRALAASAEEQPAAVVVVSDGRLDDPSEDASEATLRAVGDVLHAPIAAIATTRNSPADASVRRVSAAGAAVAHVPLPVRVEVGCAGGLACDELTVTARELRDDGPPAVLASGIAHVKDGKGALDLTIVLDRAGARIVEIAVSPQPADAIPENDRRFVTFDVTRDRVRLLHVAGRPTNDVRALRQWIKSDASVDVVAFFILRTPTDDVRAAQNDLALIPFPVDELFQEHLRSFDAIVLQDFDAQPYGLEKYLENIRQYVRRGGGLVMVGGENSFVAGGYSGTPLADVLPVELDGSLRASSADTSPFVPEWTPEGHASPLLSPLRAVVEDELPQMPGANVLGDLRPGGVALWSHPTRTTKSGAKMPVLAVGDEGDGRTIALGVDGAWELEFSELGARTSGRGHGALWDGLLGWLMRDPRFEPAQLEVVGGCTAGLPATLRARMLRAGGSAAQTVTLEVTRIDRGQPPIHIERPYPADAQAIDLALPPLETGGYTARFRVADGATTRYDFACEAGGDEWADSRPDPTRLEALARSTGGAFAFASDAGSLPLPRPTIVSAERHVTPLAPPWAWTTAAALLLGVHWIARRRGGLP